VYSSAGDSPIRDAQGEMKSLQGSPLKAVRERVSHKATILALLAKFAVAFSNTSVYTKATTHWNYIPR
jgi:hypothetical protein